jgi:branched-chain amino acid transport system ATP-binding protein
MPILETKNLSKSFGALQAVSNVSLQMEEGSLTSVIGPNGAGKTTLFNLISGRYVPNSGAVLLKGENIAGLPPHVLVRKGMGRSFQITNIFPELTVLTNVCVALTASSGRSYDCLHALKSSREILGEASAIVESVGLSEYTEYRGSALSHGDRKLLEFAMVLAMKPIIMLLDEPTAGMNQEETNNTVRLIREISRERNITVLLTEHDIDLVFSISDRIAVLNQGRLIAEGTPAEIRANDLVKKAYLGEDE